MPATYEPVSTRTLTVATADVVFTSIPQTYTDLLCVIHGGCQANAAVSLRFNNDNGSNNYSSTVMDGYSSAAYAAQYSTQSFMRLGHYSTWGGGLYDSAIIHIFQYSNATTYKSVMARTNSMSLSSTGMTSGVWRGTIAGINEINFMTNNGTAYSIGTTFTIYGIKAA